MSGPPHQVMTPAPRLAPILAGTSLRWRIDRAALSEYAQGRVSVVFGPSFQRLDGLPRRIRLPHGRMMIIDRITDLEGEPASRGTGVIRTQTDVRPDSWFLDPAGRIPACLMAESVQAALPLMTYLGLDLDGTGERSARLLGAEIVFHGERPRAGDVIDHELRVDNHAELADLLLVSVSGKSTVSGTRRLTISNAQAGVFARSAGMLSGGLIWDPVSSQPPPAGTAEVPPTACRLRTFGQDQVRAFAEGRPEDCFGPAWKTADPPRLQQSPLLMLSHVTDFDPAGGPWQRGYLRAEMPITADDWYFGVHFVNDPCMPGSLMWQSGMQAMCFYLAALGHAIGREGWEFDIVPEHPYRGRFRGEATPQTRILTCELFVSAIAADPYPAVTADILISFDGVLAGHCPQAAMRLIPGDGVSPGTTTVRPADTAVVDGIAYDRSSMLATTDADFTRAYGPSMAACDGRVGLRLPAPPYMLMDRAARVGGPMHGRQTGTWVEAVHEVIPDAWYLADNPGSRMPASVLMETVLQPCGWLTAYTLGNTLAGRPSLMIRNLDGAGVFHHVPKADNGQLRTRAELSRLAELDDVTILTFQIDSHAEGPHGKVPVATLTSTFGLFPAEALAAQAGLPGNGEQEGWFAAGTDAQLDLETARPLLGQRMLQMIDRVTGFWPHDGYRGLGRLRAEKDIDPGAWFFAAHFREDPVQPGSLGVEAMAQLLQVYLIERYGPDICAPGFQSPTPGSSLTWKYRGQVRPADRLITVELEVTGTGADSAGVWAVADAWLRVDGLCIYQLNGLAVSTIAASR